jgi:Cof subfamily protein (haloacid dehalogenase superfamily)
MPDRTIRLLALDVDGTVVNSRHELAPPTRDALRRAVEAGVRVVLATGRRYRDALGVARAIGLESPLITASGALVKDTADHSTLFRARFAEGVIESVVAQIDRRGHEPILYTDSYAEGFDFHCRGREVGGAGLRKYLAINAPLARVAPELHVRPPAGVFAGFTMGSREEMLETERALEEAWPGALSLHVIRSPRYRDWMCEIAPAGVTKWSAIASLAADWGIGAAEICAVGDDVNDVPMLRAAGLGVAMGNASPEALAAADRVAPTHDENGVARVVEWILGRAP